MRAFLLSIALLACAAILPARAQQPLPGLTEGVHYRTIEGGSPYQKLPPGMVEVAEVFAYTCPHCAHFAPMLDAWKPKLPKHARLVLVPSVFRREDPWARAFFAAQSAKSLAVLHPRLFAAIHETGELPPNASIAQIRAFAGRVQGVDTAAFNAALQDDAALLPRLRNAYEFIVRSRIEHTPTLIVAGRYEIIGNNYDSLLANARSVVAALAPKRPAPPRKPAPKKTASKKSVSSR
ncbi:MAG: thiol:disulfide interchange protein DsbA/DsbL [Thermomonas sp.]|uniref:thiol:disulfide interchange protein DsbA/DsbL n=1 Tax=Thermomonas sp. TaxID=1971895 RepID=UPI0039E3819F